MDSNAQVCVRLDGRRPVSDVFDLWRRLLTIVEGRLRPAAMNNGAPIMWTVIDELAHLTTEQIEMALRGEVPVRALPKAEIERLYGTLTSDDPALD